MTSIPGYDAWKLRTPEEDYEIPFAIWGDVTRHKVSA